MDERIKDIVAILTESGVQTRRERAAFVAKLRDEMGLTFEQIGTQLNVGKVRAAQLYALNKLFNKRPQQFANLGTRAWRFLQNVAHWKKFPEGWEESPEAVAKLLNVLAQMTPQECLKFRSCGRTTLAEIEQLLQAHGMSLEHPLGEAMEDDIPGPSSPDVLIEKLQHHLVNDLGARPNEFKFYLKGTYPGPYAENADVVLSARSGTMAEVFDHGSYSERIGQLARQLGYHMEHATSSVLCFYLDDGPDYAVDPEPPDHQWPDVPTSNLADIQF